MAKKDPVPNHLFWEARQRLNLSRSKLADDANQEPIMRTCAHAPMNENYIGRIEQGRIGGGMCDARKAALCARLKVADPVDIGLVAYRRPPTRIAPTLRQGRPAAVPAAAVLGERTPRCSPEELVGGFDLAMVSVSGVAIDAEIGQSAGRSGAGDVVNAALDRSHAATDLVEFTAALDQRGIGSAELTAIELATERLDHEFAQLPPDEVLAKARMLMKRVGVNLGEPQTLRHHERLVRLGARLAGLRAWACFDVDDHGEAHRWYEIAVDAAQDAKAWDLGAWLLGAQSLIPWHRRDLARTIDLIERGIYFAGQGSDATTRAWLYALHARGCAGAGNRDGFETAYGLAQEAAEYSTERDRRHGMDFADGTLDLRYYSGTSRLLLREPQQAHRELSGSLAALPESHTKARAVLTLFLADAAVQSGDTTQAENLMQQALASTMHQPILPILQQSRRIRRLVQQRDPAAAERLNDRVHEFSHALTRLASKANP